MAGVDLAGSDVNQRHAPHRQRDARRAQRPLPGVRDQFMPDGHEYIALSKKLVDQDGNLIAGISAGVDGDDNGDIDGIWVEEPYRNQGLGTYLLCEMEREAKEKGAYVILTYACDWSVRFFEKNGYTKVG